MHDLVQVLVRRSSGDPVKSSPRGPGITILKMLCIGACMKCLLGCSEKVLVWRSSKILYIEGPCWRSLEILLHVLVWGSGMRSWWVDIALLLVPKQVPAAAVTAMSNLICFCSMATVACIWHIDFLLPKLFGVSRRNIFCGGELSLEGDGYIMLDAP